MGSSSMHLTNIPRDGLPDLPYSQKAATYWLFFLAMAEGSPQSRDILLGSLCW